MLVYRAVRRLMDAVSGLVEQLEADPEARRIFNDERGGAGYSNVFEMNWDHVFPRIIEVEIGLQDGIVQSLGADPIASIEEALRYTKEALPSPGSLGGDPRVLAEAVDHFSWAVGDLDDYCDRQAISVFGHWGWYWFKTAATKRFSLDDFADPNTVGLGPGDIIGRMCAPAEEDSPQKWTEVREARNRWVYEQVMANVKYPTIINNLKSQPVTWQRISTVQGIKGVARRYAKVHNLPEPDARLPGRPTGT